MVNSGKKSIRIALPSKGALEKPALDFLASAGITVYRPNERQYTAIIPAMPNIEVLFQRATDIPQKVEEGTVDIGITGYDVLSELASEFDRLVMIIDDLQFGRCDLVLAVPESWIDVTNIEDLAEISSMFKEKGQSLKIATKYPYLARQWLYKKGIFSFSLVEAQGALEAAPGIGYADIILDVTSTGTTLKENHLKTIDGGTILHSQACLIRNKELLLGNQTKLYLVKNILELIEGYLRAKRFVSVTANIVGDSAALVANRINSDKKLSGLKGPTITKVFPKIKGEEDWYAITIVVETNDLIRIIEHLRESGGTDIVVQNVRYVFDTMSKNYVSLLEKLKHEK